MIWGFAVWLACTNVAKIPSKSDTWLEDHLRSSASVEAQIAMIEEMAIRRNPNSITLLVQKSTSVETDIRKASMKALVDFGPNFVDDRRDQQYLSSLEDDNRAVRKLAAQGISERLQSEVQTTFLINSLLTKAGNHQQWMLQMEALELLQWVKGAEVDAICIALSTQATNPQVRKRAISIVGTRQLETAKPMLHDIARTDLEPEVRQAAKDALVQIGGKVNDIVAAVMPFTVQGTDPSDLAVGFQHYLSGALSSGEVATIVERGQVDSVMSELVFQDTFIDDNQAIQIGQSLRASQVITGTIQFQGNRSTITVKRIDVASHEIISSAQVSGLTLDFDALQRDVSAQFIEKF